MRNGSGKATANGRDVWAIIAICLGIAVAFGFTIFISIRTSVSIAQSYTEGSSEFFASELNANLSSFVESQSAGVRTYTYDAELVEFLRAETEVGTGATARGAAVTLGELVQDPDDSSAFVVSGNTSTCYVSNGYILDIESRPDLQAWVQRVRSMSRTATSPASGDYSEYFLRRESHTLPMVYVGRPLYNSSDLLVGIVGISVYGRPLERIVKRASATNAQGAYIVSPDGTVLFSSDDATASGLAVTDAFPQFSQLCARYESDPSGDCATLWEGLDSLLPNNQCLYELHWLSSFNCYLLTTNRAEGLFDEVRSEVQRESLSILVLLVLVVVLVLIMVHRYRSVLLSAARTDELTGLANRTSFSEAYDALEGRGRLAQATLALLDIDLFKRVNDTYGHAAGDRALAAVAAEAMRCVGDEGLAGRWGGDEFIVVLRCDDAEALGRLRELIRRVEALEIEGCPRLTVSAGATRITPGWPLNRIVEQADAALYLTKGQGRNGLNMYVEGVTPNVGEL